MKTRLLLTSVSLVAAFAILGISLSAVTLVQSSSGDQSSTQRELYFSSDILPDHIAYPVLMAVDRVRLEAAAPVERIYLQTEYANRRLGYAQKLLEQGDTNLAVTTVTKSQKYLLHAAHDALDNDVSPSVKKHILDTMAFHHDETKKIGAELNDSQRAVVDSLLEECNVVGNKLASTL